MSNATRKQLGLQTENLRVKMKNKHLPLHDLCLGQNVVMQDPTSRRLFPVVITKLCTEPRSYEVTTKEGVTYRKMQSLLKLYIPEDKQNQDNAQKPHMWTLSNECKKNMYNDSIAQSRLKRHIKPPVKLNL